MENFKSENRNQSGSNSGRSMAQLSAIDSKKQQAFEKFQASHPATDALMKAMDLIADNTCNDADFEKALTAFGYGTAGKEAVKSKDPEVLMNQLKHKLFDTFQSQQPSTSAMMKAMELLADNTCNETDFEESLKMLK